MHSHLLTPEERFLEQQMRDDNNPGCIAFRKANKEREKMFPRSEQQKKNQEELSKRYKEEEILGYGSIRYDYPEYHWRMEYNDRIYLRSSCNWNVYDYFQCSVIVGTWNDAEKKIEFVDDKNKKIKFLEEEIAKMKEEIAMLKCRLE